MREGTRLKDLGQWVSGGTPPREEIEHWDGSVPWLSGKDFDRDRLRPASVFITEQAARTYSRVVPADALVLLVRGMALVHGLPVGRLESDAAINQDVRALIPSKKYSSPYIRYALLASRGELGAHIDRAAHGTARMLESAYLVRVPVYPLRAQREITHFLDRECERTSLLDGKLTELVRALYESNAEARSRALTGLRSRPVRLGFALRGIDQGWSPQCEERAADPGEWGVLKVGCVNGEAFRPAEHKALPPGLSPRPDLEVKIGDSLMSRANTRELVGSTARVTEACQWRLMLCDKLYRLRFDETKLNPEFGVLALSARETRDQIEVATAGASSSMQNISQSIVRDLKIPVPPLTEQRRVVALLRTRAERSACAVEAISRCKARLAEYRDALITEAVTGQLDVGTASDSQMDERAHAALEGASA